jgi:hypothetical protein
VMGILNHSRLRSQANLTTYKSNQSFRLQHYIKAESLAPSRGGDD